MKLDFDPQELERLVDTLAVKVVERLRPLLKDKGQDGDKIFTVEGLAQYLGVKKTWVYEKVHRKEIPYLKVGKFPRFRQKTIDAWLEDNYTSAVNTTLNHLRGGIER